MLCMLFSNILDYKVINNKGEGYGYVFLGPDSWVGFNRMISVLLQVLLKYVMCNYLILWKTIHTLYNLNIDIYVV